MIFESLAIIGIVLAMALIFLRAHKKEYFLGLLPLTIMPVTQIMVIPVTKIITGFTNVRTITVCICMTFIAIIVESILLGLASANLHTKAQKTTFLCMCGAFTLVLAMIYILNAMKTATAFSVACLCF